jgi:hypothetical protein
MRSTILVARSARAVGAVHTRQHDEFVAADPRHRIDPACAAIEAFSNLTQQLVANRMAECIVDGLEAIEVDAQDGEAFLVVARAPDRVADALVQQVAVGKSGKRVMMGEPLQLARLVAGLGFAVVQIVANAVEPQSTAPPPQ